jgi:hypothetical protein
MLPNLAPGCARIDCYAGGHSELHAAASEVAVAACYIATVEHWGELKRNWDEINAKENFCRFHMAWLISLAGRGNLPRQNGRTTKKRTGTISKLVSVITTRMTLGVVAAVMKSAYERSGSGQKCTDNSIVRASVPRFLPRAHLRNGPR